MSDFVESVEKAVIEELETKITRLKKMVQDAYNAGFSEGMKDFTSNKGGVPWSESRFRRDVEK